MLAELTQNPGPRVEAVVWKESGSSPLSAEEPCRETGGSGSSLWGCRCYSSIVWSSSTMRMLALRVLF